MSSGKFRHNNRKYRIAGSSTPSSANGRPSAARSSDEEEYLSDFDRFDELEAMEGEGEGEGRGLYVVGESINDKLQLSSEFESDFPNEGGDGEGEEGDDGDDYEDDEGYEVIREEEGLQVSPPSRPGVKTIAGSAMEHDDHSDEIDEYYESDFSLSPNHRPPTGPLTTGYRGDSAESDIYDESFEHSQSSPQNKGGSVGSNKSKGKKPKTNKTKKTSTSVNNSNNKRDNGKENQNMNPETAERQSSEEALINPLSEFSSITFADSMVNDETSVLLGNNAGNPSSDSIFIGKEKKASSSKVVVGGKKASSKSSSSHVTWKNGGDGVNNSNKVNGNSKMTKKVSNGVPIPTQPRSRPGSQAGGGVAMVGSSSAANSPGKSVSSGTGGVGKGTSISKPGIPGSIKGATKGNNTSSTAGGISVTSSTSTHLPTMKFQAIKISASSASASMTTGGGATVVAGIGGSSSSVSNNASISEGVSVLTQGSSIAGTGSVAAGGGGGSVVGGGKSITSSYLSAVPHQTPITSTISQRNSLPANELQRQLARTLRRLEEYKQQNVELREQLDGSTIYGIIEKLKHEMIDKDARIQHLVNENNALKYVSRHQGKQLVENEIAKQYEPEIVDIQTKYLEVMNEQLKHVRNKLNVSRENEKQLTLKNEKKDALIVKLRTKVNKWKKAYKEIYEELRTVRESQQVGGGGEGSSQQPPPSSSLRVQSAPSTSDNNQELWSKQEKNYLMQVKSLQRDIQQMKQSAQEQEQKKKQLEEELKKRELFARHQTSVIRGLRHEYEDLLEGNRQLMQAAALYNRDTAAPIKKEPKKKEVIPPPPVIKLPEPPVVVEEPLKANARMGLIAEDDGEEMASQDILTDEIDGQERDTMTFLTRVDDGEGNIEEDEDGEQDDHLIMDDEKDSMEQIRPVEIVA